MQFDMTTVTSVFVCIIIKNNNNTVTVIRYKLQSIKRPKLTVFSLNLLLLYVGGRV